MENDRKRATVMPQALRGIIMITILIVMIITKTMILNYTNTITNSSHTNIDDTDANSDNDSTSGPPRSPIFKLQAEVLRPA